MAPKHVLSPTRTHAVQALVWEDLVVVVDNGRGRPHEYAALLGLATGQSRRYPGGIGCLVIIPGDATPPSDDARKALNHTLESVAGSLRCMCWLVEGSDSRGRWSEPCRRIASRRPALLRHARLHRHGRSAHLVTDESARRGGGDRKRRRRARADRAAATRQRALAKSARSLNQPVGALASSTSLAANSRAGSHRAPPSRESERRLPPPRPPSAPTTQRYRVASQARVADLRAELVGAERRGRRAAPSRRSSFETRTRVRVDLVAHREDDRLLRRDPHREVPAAVLEVDAEEALDRAEDGAVEHDRPVVLAVLADVRELEALGQVRVVLERAELPARA